LFLIEGRKGRSLRAITIEEVQQHTSEYDVWTVYEGRVYNLTPYLHYHPGGLQILLGRGVAGSDCTELFKKYHKWVNGHAMLQKCELGWILTNPELVIPEESNGDTQSDDDTRSSTGEEKENTTTRL